VKEENILMAHIPVLTEEVIRYLNPRPGENFIDGTCGRGGHTLAILKNIGEDGRILGIDLDNKALEQTKQKIKTESASLLSNLILVEDNFANLEKTVRQKNFGPINGILLDLGMSSEQLEESGRGFSFLKDEPLDMRFSEGQGLSAVEIVNQWLPRELEKILKEYGEERFAGRIAKEIIRIRKIKLILRTGELVRTIALAVPKKYQHGRIHFATRTFQALRIVVNDELENLQKFLPQAVKVLKAGGRLVIISFHSLEDRIVKNFFREQARQGKVEILTKKPAVPAPEEILKNPRSRSAKLRAAQKL
jgi:16S rRNA (cytosine1402-N4)-methyltransferase